MFRFFTVLFLSLCMVTNSYGWGFEAHIIASRLAWKRLSPEAKEEVTRLLKLREKEIVEEYEAAMKDRKKPYMKALPTDLSLFEKACMWADLHRPDDRKTATFHYLSGDIDDEKLSFEKLDKKGVHVVAKVSEFSKTLADRGKLDDERATALVYLIHLAQDLNQPLHIGSNGDLGGNRAQVRLDLGGKEKGSNLHAVWDYALLESTEGGFEVHFAEVTKLDTDENFAIWGKGSVEDWANESFLLAKAAYVNPLTDRRFENGDPVEERYRTKHLPVVNQQICKSGFRLAFLLNECTRKGD